MGTARSGPASVPDDRPVPADVAASSPFLRRLDNFWYHYKWTAIVVAFFAVLLVVLLVQCLGRPKYDTSLIYAGSHAMSKEERAAFETLFSEALPEDRDGDGQTRVSFEPYLIYSEDEIEAEAEACKQAGAPFACNPDYNRKQRETFLSCTMAGRTSVYLVSPYLYGILTSGHRLRSLADLHPDGLPQGARPDGYGVNFAETEFFARHAEAQALPEDTILCVLIPTILEKSSREGEYRTAVSLYRALTEPRAKG